VNLYASEMPPKPDRNAARASRHGVARVISKFGMASRSQAAEWVHEGRVRVNGRPVRDPDFPVLQGQDRISVDQRDIAAAARVVLMLNKPRGLVTTREDEQGRATVYRCLSDAPLPWLAPVGRLDKASEGLLLFTNDPAWAAQLTNPATGPDKTYHVQIDCVPNEALLNKLASGAPVEGDWLRFKSVRCMRSGLKNAWLEVILDEGRNRQIRRVLEACDVSVLRLVRVGIGGLALGELQKGHWRLLSEPEIALL
jgi:23S rRNA pseudouridine2605 synthase